MWVALVVKKSAFSLPFKPVIFNWCATNVHRSWEKLLEVGRR